MARRGRRGGYFSLQNLFALNSRLHGNLQHALRLSVCVCLCVCVAALMQYVKATRSIYSKYNNNKNKSDNDSSNNNNDKYTKHEY